MKAMNLLVLEHDPDRREKLLAALRAVGDHAVAAPDGTSAASALAGAGFDVLVLDLRYPDLDLARLQEAVAPAAPAVPESLDAAERRHIALVLRHTGGNKRQAALLLGISRSTLLHKVRKYGLAAVLLTLFVMLPALTWRAAAQDTPVPPGRAVEGTLAFDGHATAGDFVGTTDAVSGEMTGGASLTDVQGWVEAPVRSLTTSNGHRDRDLNKSMESDKYPAIRFDLKSVSAAAGAMDSTPVTLDGALTLHGVSRDVSLPGYVRREGERLRVRTDFPVVLTDYKIGGLSKMLGMLKMDEHITVHVNVVFAPTR
jgi:polyisoprenoid-binding protein YceI